MLPAFVFILLLFLKCTSATRPRLAIQDDLKSDKAKWNTVNSILKTEFNDMITLARVVVLTGSDCDEAFLRYFKKDDYPFVQAMFGAIANIDAPLSPDPNEALQILSTFDLDSTLSNFWGELLVSYEDLDPVTCAEMENLDGYLIYDYEAPRPLDPRYPWKGSGYLVLCRDRATMKYTVPLELLGNPPAWGREGGEANGEPLVGFGCDGMGPRDTGFMEPTGVTHLHEIFHWPVPFLQVEDYDKNIKENYDNGHQILDWEDLPAGATDSYGPYNAMLINQLPLTSDGFSPALNNAENYVWYALSKYWSWKCGK
ncbi:hypothetical protein H2200_010151 [Cladophialophora chaetospira]|uniref:Uncharacterized protein n=1 Tax=Cladophialophora chaetospira TaxID=386627 RepID=A0AA39CER2_9EURO|nr:hypothetical protein H2200_010151 [Cladophialophora chaetospira]